MAAELEARTSRTSFGCALRTRPVEHGAAEGAADAGAAIVGGDDDALQFGDAFCAWRDGAGTTAKPASASHSAKMRNGWASVSHPFRNERGMRWGTRSGGFQDVLRRRRAASGARDGWRARGRGRRRGRRRWRGADGIAERHRDWRCRGGMGEAAARRRRRAWRRSRRRCGGGSWRRWMRGRRRRTAGCGRGREAGRRRRRARRRAAGSSSAMDWATAGSQTTSCASSLPCSARSWSRVRRDSRRQRPLA